MKQGILLAGSLSAKTSVMHGQHDVKLGADEQGSDQSISANFVEIHSCLSLDYFVGARGLTRFVGVCHLRTCIRTLDFRHESYI